MKAVRPLFVSASLAAVLVSGPIAATAAQQPVPRPFPTPGSSAPQAPPRPSAPPAQPGNPAGAVAPAPATAAGAQPTEATLGLPIFPQAQFIASYDATRGQRYYLFGTTAAFDAVVTYYRGILKDKGDLVFEEPPTQMFEVGKFREDTMAFPPGVTVKDYTWAGSQGYPNPRRGAPPERFPTVIQIVPAPPERTR